MSKFMKHVGKDKLGNRVVVVFRELPEDPEHCLVVRSDALIEMYHDNLMKTVGSNTAQATVNLYEVLSRSHFSDGGQMLNTLHERGLLQKVPVTDIKMEPLPNRQVPLRDVNKAIAEGNIPEAPAEVAEAQTPVDSPVLVDTSLAESKLLQARLMEDDAKKLREEAYDLDPDLKKGGRPSKKQQKKVAKAQAEANAEE